MGNAIAIVNLINAILPGVASLIMIIKRKDGTISVAALLDEADSQFDKNIQQATDWLKANK